MKRCVLIALATGAALVLPATSAFAHVTVNPREANAGGYAKLAFRVPNERDNASTTKLEIAFPTDHPFASVSVRPKEGWAYTVSEPKLDKPRRPTRRRSPSPSTGSPGRPGPSSPANSRSSRCRSARCPRTWTRSRSRRSRPIAMARSSAGSRRRHPAGAEPERPAPVLKLTKAAATTATTAPPAESQAGEVASGEDAASKSDVDNARVFGILGMVFGLLGFVSAMAARRRRPDPPSETSA